MKSRHFTVGQCVTEAKRDVDLDLFISEELLLTLARTKTSHTFVSPDHVPKSTARLSELKGRFLSNLKPEPDPGPDYEVSRSQFTATADAIFAAVWITLFVDLQVVQQITHRDSSLSHTALFPNMQHI